jgi:N-acetylmuramoyl-L-alanine amidase
MDHPGSRVCGHRDLSPDLNGNGKVDPWERLKECPCYEVSL